MKIVINREFKSKSPRITFKLKKEEIEFASRNDTSDNYSFQNYTECCTYFDCCVKGSELSDLSKICVRLKCASD